MWSWSAVSKLNKRCSKWNSTNTNIIYLSLTTSAVPIDFKKAEVCIYNSWSTTELKNCRAISVLPIVSRIMERGVHRQMYKGLDETKLISKHPFGFQKKKSAELAARSSYACLARSSYPCLARSSYACFARLSYACLARSSYACLARSSYACLARTSYACLARSSYARCW